jgi:activator of HSP90 ATPase
MNAINYNFNQKINGAIVQLRKQKHQAGFPFMITDEKELLENQAYMEYADGHIEIVEFTKDYRDYRLLKTLNEQEVSTLRQKYNLEDA